MDFYRLAKKYRDSLTDEITLLDNNISKSPPGRLKINKSGNRYKYYQRLDDGTRKYIPKKNIDLASALASKAFYKRKYIELRRELKYVESYIKNHNNILVLSDDMESSGSELSRLISMGQSINNGIATSDRLQLGHNNANINDIAEWINEDYIRNELYPEQLNVRTVGGLMVRSKSEAYIASELSNNKIPYRYECLLELGGIHFYPDFTILNPLTHEILYWEHFGLMDSESYVSSTINKLSIYLRNGIIPSLNLIITSETEDKPLDFEVVKKMIESFLT